jgi:Domain of unknown function (DUF4262)
MDAGERKTLADIEQFGCHVIHVLEEDDLPPFAYSVGIEKTTGAPEIVVIGLKQPLAHFIVNEYNLRVRNGEKLEAGMMVSDFVGGFDCQLRAVHPSHYDEYFGQNIWLYENRNFRVLQLVYPSTDGIWVWEENASEYFQRRQPLLDCVAAIEA